MQYRKGSVQENFPTPKMNFLATHNQQSNVMQCLRQCCQFACYSSFPIGLGDPQMHYGPNTSHSNNLVTHLIAISWSALALKFHSSFCDRDYSKNRIGETGNCYKSDGSREGGKMYFSLILNTLKNNLYSLNDIQSSQRQARSV